ncbi:unnamed protein product [Phytophthora lilii]|uniref:Unnamed protein product n=1 Tax=Phytophthora lilii TaxID=2077276 RepID=A0A9W6TCY4_9STRA|nr:unnamed protein product [Phytophthora lilii]
MEPALPHLSSFLQPTRRIIAPSTNIEVAISALTQHFESQLHKRKQSFSADGDSEEMTSFQRSNRLSRESKEAQASPLLAYERVSFSSRSSSQGGDTPGRESPTYFAGELSPTTPRRERTSRYLSEGDRKVIIARIDNGEKQVALAKEFNVSRAAICNLYKNRWEVLTRGVRDPTATHPKRSHKKASLRQMSPATHSSAVVTPTSSDVSSVQANADSHGENLSPTQARMVKRDEQMSWSGAQREVPQQNRSVHHNEVRPRNLLREEANPRDRGTHHDATGNGPKQFLVHEASAYLYPCRKLVSTLRDESISTVVFQQRVLRLARLLIEEVLTCLPHNEEEITNKYGDLCHTMKALDASEFCAVSMEEKGMVLLRAFSDISPASPTGVVSLETRSTALPRHIFSQLPPVSSHQFVLLLDVECAAGERACAAIHHLVHEQQIPAQNIYFVTVISAFEGLQNVFQHFPGESSGAQHSQWQAVTSD